MDILKYNFEKNMMVSKNFDSIKKETATIQ